MKTKITWRPGKKNAGRSSGTAQRVSPYTELFSQVNRTHSAMA